MLNIAFRLVFFAAATLIFGTTSELFGLYPFGEHFFVPRHVGKIPPLGFLLFFLAIGLFYVSSKGPRVFGMQLKSPGWFIRLPVIGVCLAAIFIGLQIAAIIPEPRLIPEEGTTGKEALAGLMLVVSSFLFAGITVLIPRTSN